MADVGELRVRITADASGLKAVLVDAQQTVQRTGGVFASLRDNLTPINQGIELLKTAFTGLIRVADGVASAFAAPIAAAAEQDKVTSQLEATLASTGQLTAEYANSLADLADAQSLVKNVQDDVVLGAERTLIAFGAQREELPRLTDAVLDLATKTGDVGQAAFLVGKALTGQVESLSRYGIKVDEAATKSEKLDSALEQIQQRFGGQAAAAAATFSGRLGIVGIAFGQLQERIGQIITQNPVVLSALSGIAQGFVQAKEAIEVFLGPLEDAISGLVAFATIQIAEGLEGLADAAEDIPVIASGLRAFADGLRSSNTAARDFKANLAGVSEEVAEGGRGAERFGTIIKEVSSTGRLVFRTIGAAIEEVGGSLKTLTDKLADTDTKLKPLESIGALIGEKLKQKLPEVEDALVNFALNVGEKMAVELVKGFGRALLGLDKLIEAELAKISPTLARHVEEWKRTAGGMSDVIQDALTPGQAAAAEIPLEFVPPDPTQANAVIDETKARATEPIELQLRVPTPRVPPLVVPTTTLPRLTLPAIKVPPVDVPPIAIPEVTVPSVKLRADPTEAQASLDRVQADAAQPMETTLKLDTKQAEVVGQSFISRMLHGLAEITEAGQKAFFRIPIVTGLPGPEPPEPPPGPAAAAGVQVALAAALAATQAQEQAHERVEEAITAEVRAQERLTREIDASKGAEGEHAAAIAQSAAELEQMRAQFREINKGVEFKLQLDTGEALSEASTFSRQVQQEVAAPKVVVGFDTTEADRQAETIEARIARIERLQPVIAPQVVVPRENRAELDALEERVRRLDNLHVEGRVDLTIPATNDLQALIDKANEISALTPNLNVIAGQSFEESQASVTALIEDYKRLNETVATPQVDMTSAEASFAAGLAVAEQFQATAGAPITAKVTADTLDLTPQLRELEDFKKEVSEGADLTVDTTQVSAAFGVVSRGVKQIKTEGAEGITLDANIARVIDKLGIIRTDISAGVDPITIDAEISGVQKAINTAREELKTLDKTAQITATIKLDKQQAELDDLKLKAQVEEPSTKKVNLDTTQAQQQVAELNAQIAAAQAAAIANVARGGGQITGQAASRDEIQQIVAQAGRDLADAIRSGDQGRITAIAADLRAFEASFGRFQGQSTIPTDIAKALQDLKIATLGAGAGFGRGAAGADLASTIRSEIGDAQRDVAQKQAEANRLQQEQNATATRTAAATERVAQTTAEQNALLRENNQLAKEQLVASRSSFFGAQQLGAALNQLSRQAAVQATGNRNAGSGTFG